MLAAQRQLLLSGLTPQVIEPAPQKSLLPVAVPRRERISLAGQEFTSAPAGLEA